MMDLAKEATFLIKHGAVSGPVRIYKHGMEEFGYTGQLAEHGLTHLTVRSRTERLFSQQTNWTKTEGTSCRHLYVITLINPRRACAARVTVVGLCLFVDDYSRTTGYEAAYERYQQLQCYKGMKKNVAILLKRLRSRDMT